MFQMCVVKYNIYGNKHMYVLVITYKLLNWYV